MRLGYLSDYVRNGEYHIVTDSGVIKTTPDLADIMRLSTTDKILTERAIVDKVSRRDVDDFLEEISGRYVFSEYGIDFYYSPLIYGSRDIRGKDINIAVILRGDVVTITVVSRYEEYNYMEDIV